MTRSKNNSSQLAWRRSASLPAVRSNGGQNHSPSRAARRSALLAVSLLMDELADWFACAAPRRSGWIAHRDHRSYRPLRWNAENLLRLLPAFIPEPANRCAYPVGMGSEQDALRNSPFVEGFALGPLPGHDEHHRHVGARQVLDVAADPGQLGERLTLSDHHDLRKLSIARTARPASDLQDVLDHVVRDRLRRKLAHSAKAAHEIGQLEGGRCLSQVRAPA